MPTAEHEFSIRDARPEDLPQVLTIYNHYVVESMATFDEQPLTLAGLNEKFTQARDRGLPFLVAESAGGHLGGYAYAHQWRAKAAYRYTVENTIYLSPAATGRGLGRMLMAELIERCRLAGIREVIAVISDEGTEASIALHRTFGFTEIGRLSRVGFKFDRWVGTVLMQKTLQAE